MQSVSSRIWTRVAVSISYDDNHYTTGTSWPRVDVAIRALFMGQIDVWKLFVFDKNTWNHIVIYLAFCLAVAQGRMNEAPNETRMNEAPSETRTHTWNYITMSKQMVIIMLDRNTWNHISKVSDLSWGWSKGSLFNNYNTQV